MTTDGREGLARRAVVVTDFSDQEPSSVPGRVLGARRGWYNISQNAISSSNRRRFEIHCRLVFV